MPDKTGIQEPIADAAYKLRTMPVEDWAGWVLYFLEILDGKDGQRGRPIWLDDIRDSINDRMTHGKW